LGRPVLAGLVLAGLVLAGLVLAGLVLAGLRAGRIVGRMPALSRRSVFMDLCTVFVARTSQVNAGIATAISDQVAIAGTHNAQLLIEEFAG
jgi:hypothetical protein